MCDRRAFCTLLAASAAAPWPARGQGGGAPQGGVWKLATGYRLESFHGQNLLQFTREAAHAASGLQWELHPNNSLHKLADIPAAVRTGQTQAGETIMSNLTQLAPLAGADAVPFMVRGYADARRLWQHQQAPVAQQLQAQGLRALMAVPWPPQGLYSTRAVENMASLRGSRMRTYNATTVRIAQLLGATPVDVPMVDVGRALAQGHIDCMITSAVTGVENKVWESVGYYYDINAWIPKNLTFVNAQAFALLPAPAQAQVLQAAAAAQERGWVASERAAQESLQSLRQHGMKLDRPTLELMADLKRLGERFSREWIHTVGPRANDIFIPFYSS